MKPKIKKAVLPIAGVGTRMLPVTKAVPKELLPIGNKPIIQYLVEEAIDAGIEEIVFVLSWGKEIIADYFDKHSALEYFLEKKGKSELLQMINSLHKLAKFVFVRQSEPLGDGDAILCAREIIGNEPFLVLFGDDLVKNDISAAKQLVSAYNKVNSCIMTIQEIPPEDVSLYGIIEPKKQFGNLYEVKSLIEKPSKHEAPSNLGIIGKYICTPDIFDILAKHPRGRDGEIRLIDAFRELINTQPIYALKFQGERFDTGTLSGYIEGILSYAWEDMKLQKTIKKFIDKKIL